MDEYFMGMGLILEIVIHVVFVVVIIKYIAEG